MWDKKITLKNELFDNGARFEFFEAARLLCLLTKEAPDGPGSGSKTPVRFRSAATGSFPAGEVYQLERSEELVELFTSVIGLFGPTGVLPHHDKDMVSGGEPNLLMRDFLDIFNSRIITLFFHAWQTNRQDVSLEMFRRNINAREDACSMVLLSLCGVGLPQTRNQYLFSDDAFASSAGLLSRSVRSASSLQRCLAGQFSVPVRVIEFIEERIHLPDRIQTSLTSRRNSYNQLGVSAIAGRSVASHNQRFEVRMGPLNRTEFETLCPYDDKAAANTSRVPRNIGFRRLVEFIRATMGRPLDFDIRLEVEPDAVQPSRLGSTRLGFDSWVLGQQETGFREDMLKRFKWDSTTN